MEPKNKYTDKINALAKILINGEMARDPRSFLRKAYKDIIHNSKALLERLSPIN